MTAVEVKRILKAHYIPILRETKMYNHDQICFRVGGGVHVDVPTDDYEEDVKITVWGPSPYKEIIERILNGRLEDEPERIYMDNVCLGTWADFKEKLDSGALWQETLTGKSFYLV